MILSKSSDMQNDQQSLMGQWLFMNTAQGARTSAAVVLT